METSPKKHVIELSRKELPTTFRELSWILSARSTDPKREHLSKLHIEGEWAVCTDGYRLHARQAPWFTKHLEEGNYDIVEKTGINIAAILENTPSKFPDWKAAFPSVDATVDQFPLCFVPEKAEAVALSNGELSKLYATMCRKITHTTYKISQIGDLAGDEYTVLSFGESKPLCFMASFRIALVAPLYNK